MEYVAFEYVLDFELERSSSTKFRDVIYFADENKIFFNFVYGNNNKKSVECF